jgi:hypothetical protein
MAVSCLVGVFFFVFFFFKKQISDKLRCELFAGHVVGDAVLKTADQFGVKSHVEAAAELARKAAKDGRRNLTDANKNFSKVNRLAKKIIEFDDEDDSLTSNDYHLLMSVPGAVEKTIGIIGVSTQTFVIPAGSVFVFKARVRFYDIAFALRERKEDGRIEDIIPLARYKAEERTPMQGQLPAADHERTILLVFDNSYSQFQAKRVVFWVACGEKVSLADDVKGAAMSMEVQAAEEGPSE